MAWVKLDGLYEHHRPSLSCHERGRKKLRGRGTGEKCGTGAVPWACLREVERGKGRRTASAFICAVNPKRSIQFARVLFPDPGIFF